MSAKLGHFELLEQIGKGTLTTVFRAYDPTLQSEIALKLLDEEIVRNNPQLAQNFINESQNAATIIHPNIARIYTVGEVEGNYYVAMELLTGRSLNDIVRENGPLSEVDALEIGVQTAKTLQAAYSKRLLHGNIKPQNIFISADGTVKLLDLGLIKSANTNALTSADSNSLGLAYFVSPERAAHKPENFRSDVYSLGATLYFAMSGRPPLVAGSLAELARKRLNENPPGLRKLNPRVSSKTEQLITKMMNKNAFQRCTEYGTLIQELNAVWTKASARIAQSGGKAAGFQAGAPAVGQFADIAKNKFVWITLACSVGALILGIVITFLLLHNKKPDTGAPPPVASATPLSSPVAATPQMTPVPAPSASPAMAVATPEQSTPAPALYPTPASAFSVPTLLVYNFSVHRTGGESGSAPRLISNQITGSIIKRGSGLTPKNGVPLPGTFSSLGSGDALTYGADLNEVIDEDQYYEFSVTPMPGKILSISSLEFYPFFQAANKSTYMPNARTTTRGAGITYSTDGVKFSKGIAASGNPSEGPTKFIVNLKGQTPLQTATTTVIFRIYLFGAGPLEYTGFGKIEGRAKPQNEDIILSGAVR